MRLIKVIVKAYGGEGVLNIPEKNIDRVLMILLTNSTDKSRKKFRKEMKK